MFAYFFLYGVEWRTIVQEFSAMKLPPQLILWYSSYYNYTYNNAFNVILTTVKLGDKISI